MADDRDMVIYDPRHGIIQCPPEYDQPPEWIAVWGDNALEIRFVKGEAPNAFHRLMTWLLLGVKWTRGKDADHG